jgi:hypothetical protein
LANIRTDPSRVAHHVGAEPGGDIAQACAVSVVTVVWPVLSRYSMKRRKCLSGSVRENPRARLIWR